MICIRISAVLKFKVAYSRFLRFCKNVLVIFINIPDREFQSTTLIQLGVNIYVDSSKARRVPKNGTPCVKTVHWGRCTRARRQKRANASRTGNSLRISVTYPDTSSLYTEQLASLSQGPYTLQHCTCGIFS